MTYLPKKLKGLTQEQHEALLSTSPDEISKLSPETRLSLALQHADIIAQQRAAFWDSLAAAATVALPLLAFFGIEKWRGR